MSLIANKGKSKNKPALKKTIKRTEPVLTRKKAGTKKIAKTSQGKKSKFPAHITPMLATLVSEPPTGNTHR
jgi:hypothetical protein